MVMNDYFDYVSGADVVNAPNKVMQEPAQSLATKQVPFQY